jgi:ABC-type uncharacterized transport system permease subunit
MRKKADILIFIILSSLAGYLSVGIISPTSYNYTNNRMVPIAVIVVLQLTTGALLCYLKPKQWLNLSLATVYGLIFVMFFDLIFTSKSHTLWPLELILYFLTAIPAIIGAYIVKKQRATPGSGLHI